MFVTSVPSAETHADRGVRRIDKENEMPERMRQQRTSSIWISAAAAMVLAATGASASELDDAHRQAVSGRDSYWNCLAREYSQESSKSMSGPDFTQHIAGVCPSERQYFRVALVDYLTMQFPDRDAADRMTTANQAIALAQKDIVTAFVRRHPAPQ